MEKLSIEAITKLIKDENIDTDMTDAYRAYVSLTGVNNLSDFEEAFCGQYDSDEDFARQMAEDTCSMPKNAQWPIYCIDWERAAQDLMMDYIEVNGYYFRNL